MVTGSDAVGLCEVRHHEEKSEESYFYQNQEGEREKTREEEGSGRI